MNEERICFEIRLLFLTTISSTICALEYENIDTKNIKEIRAIFFIIKKIILHLKTLFSI